jgi:ClpP class serine protease
MRNIMKPLMIELSRIEGTFRAFESTFETVGKTAIIPIYGFLTKRSGPFAVFLGTTSYEEIAESLREALASPLIERILLDVDSPGGEVNGVFDLCDQIYAARHQKQIEAIANDDAFSAAYAIASSALNLWITRTSGVGSIGVIATHIDQSTFDKNEGIKITPIFAGERKNDLTPHEPLSEAARAAMQGEIDRLYGLFTDIVARNRGLSTERIRATQAAMLFGNDAIQVGLADGFRTFDSLLAVPPVQNFFTTHNRRPKMDRETMEHMQRLEEQRLEEYLAKQPDGSEKDDELEESEDEDEEEDEEPEFTTRVNELVKLCKIAKRPELLAGWIEKGMTVAQAQESLLKEMEANEANIISAKTPAKTVESPLIQTAKNRLNY